MDDFCEGFFETSFDRKPDSLGTGFAKVVQKKWIPKLAVVKRLGRYGFDSDLVNYDITYYTVNRFSYRTGIAKTIKYNVKLIEKEGTLIKRYNPLKDGETILTDVDSFKKSFSIKQELGKKILLVLPCTSTAIDGNYFYGSTWQNISVYFPERLKDEIDFCAFDSITLNEPEKLGSFVFENEMDRVKGFDMNPCQHTYTQLEKIKLRELTHISFNRVSQLGYKRILIYVNVEIYKNMLKQVIEELDEVTRNKISFFDVSKQGGFLTNRDLLRKEFKRSRYNLIKNIQDSFRNITVKKV